MTRYMKRGGKVWINIFPHMPRTAKGLGQRQGTGKGGVDEYVAVVKEGKIMFEVGGVSEEIARDVEPKARLHRRNSYFNDHEVSNVQALRVGIVVTIATAMVVVWSMVGGIL